jgi:Ran GTPase-activating protein (RanGAP) involved in mRNA processing and transport
MAAMLQVNQTLQSLDMAGTDATTDVVIAMATVLHGNKYLEHLDISSPLLHSRGEETTVHLAEMLRVNSTLTTLHLSKHGMTDSGLFVLCKSLKENTTLQYLDLSCNKISRDGAKMLADLLVLNPPMTILDLSCNRIEDEGVEHLGNAIHTFNSTLKKLYIGYNSISDSGLATFACAIERNFVLTHLAVWGNETGVEASKAFRRLLQSGRLDQAEIDVQPYIVDEVVCLAKMDLPPVT